MRTSGPAAPAQTSACLWSRSGDPAAAAVRRGRRTRAGRGSFSDATRGSRTHAGERWVHGPRVTHEVIERESEKTVRIREIMSSPAVVVPPETTVKAAAALLAAHGFTCLPVVTGDGRLVGVVSEAELLAGRSPRTHGCRSPTASTACSARPSVT